MTRRDRARKYAQRRAHALRQDNRVFDSHTADQRRNARRDARRAERKAARS